MILCYLPNGDALDNLTKVSTVYRTVQDSFDEVLTNVAINHLAERSFDLFGPQNVMQVCLVENRGVDAEFRNAIRGFSNACQDRNSNMRSKPIALPAAVCRKVLRVLNVAGWTVADALEQIPTCSTRFATKFAYKQDKEAFWGTHWLACCLAGQPNDAVHFFYSRLVFLGEWSWRSAHFKEKVRDTIRDTSRQIQQFIRTGCISLTL